MRIRAINSMTVNLTYIELKSICNYIPHENVSVRRFTHVHSLQRPSTLCFTGQLYSDDVHRRRYAWVASGWPISYRSSFRARGLYHRILLTLNVLNLSSQWRHNEHQCVSNHLCHNCLRNRLFGRRSKKTSKLRVTGLCEGNPPAFPSQISSNAENISTLWRYHAYEIYKMYLQFISFLHTDMTLVVEILPRVRQELNYST